MKKVIALSLFGLAAAGAAQAQEVGRVLSSTPVVQQVAVPRQVCSNQQVAVQQPKSGAGAAMGAIAGGAVGNQIGGGGGRAAATILGVVGGLMLGDRIEGPGQASVQNVQQCSTQTFYENRTMSYNVVYEFNGKQYSVNMPQDPGPSVRLQVTPVSTGSLESVPPPVINGPVAPQVMAPQQQVYATQQVYTQPVYTQPVVVASPYYYARPAYYPPVSVNLGYVYGGGHRHWR
jgi:uncharacterized protein YcfJ